MGYDSPGGNSRIAGLLLRSIGEMSGAVEISNKLTTYISYKVVPNLLSDWLFQKSAPNYTPARCFGRTLWFSSFSYS